jgi:hypothetical protein
MTSSHILKTGSSMRCWKRRYTVKIISVYVPYMPITMAARSKAWTVFARSNTRIVGSNPAQGMDVCVRLFCVCFVLCVGSCLLTGWSPVQGALPTVYRIKNWKSGQGPTKSCRTIIIKMSHIFRHCTAFPFLRLWFCKIRLLWNMRKHREKIRLRPPKWKISPVHTSY